MFTFRADLFKVLISVRAKFTEIIGGNFSSFEN